VTAHRSRVIVRIIRGRIALQLAAAIAVVLALLLRVALDRYSLTLPTYVTFYPVVFLAALLGDMWAGILATALSALLADYFLLPPVGQFTIHSTSDIVGMTIFCISGISVSVIAEQYYRNRETLDPYRHKEAVRNELRKVGDAQDLSGSVLAERLRFLGVLESLRTKNFPGGFSEAGPNSLKLSGTGGESGSPSLDKRQFRALLRRTVLVPFIAALILGGAALWAAYELNASMQWVDYTDQVISQSRRLLKLTVDMETGERGYLVTGNEVFLQPYHDASKVIDSEYLTLSRLVADNPSQQARLETLHESLQHWQGYAEQMIALRRSGGAYGDLPINLAGKAEVDAIREEIAGFQAVEEHLRDERNRTAHRDWRLVETICVLLGLGIGLGLTVFTFRRMESIAASFEESGQALAESERRWATTLASIGDAVIASDNKGRVTFLNPAAVVLTGWQSDEAQGQPIQTVFHIINEQTRVAAEDIVGRVLKDGLVVELANHTALLAKDGREISIADSAAPILDNDGKIAGVVLVFRDVTERRRADDALRESRAKLFAALASMTDSVIITDAKGRFVEFNDAYAKFYRFKSKAECARNFADFASLFDVFLPSGEPVPREMWASQRALRGETAVGNEYTLQRKDSGEAWTGSISFSPIRDSNGVIIGSVVTSRDVTEAKRAEEERQISIDFLGMINQSRGTKDLVQRAASFFQKRSDCEAVAIRLREGDDYPYVETRGFSSEFVRLESKLCIRTANGKVMRDSSARPALECLCGSVIRGRFESSKPFYTAHGGFWTNSTTDLVRTATHADLPATVRHRCNREGYESVALLPMYVGEERFGLVQLNDRRTGRFSAQSILLWERLAGHLATAISKFSAEEALQESEKRYRNLFNSMNEGFCVIEVLFDADEKPEDYRFLEVNTAFENQTGLHDAVGKRMRELAPDHEEHWFEIYGRIALTGEPAHFMNEAKALNRYYDVHAYRVGEAEQRRVAIVFNDFSDYKRAEEDLSKLNRTLKALSNSNQAILRASDESAFLEEACHIITRDCGYAMVWIGIAEDDGRKTVRPVAYSGFEEGYLESLRITWDESEQGSGPTGTAIRTGEPSMCRNMLTDPNFLPWRENAIKRGYASSLAIPLRGKGQPWGAITIYAREPDAFSEGEVDLLKELARDLEFGVQSLRARAAHVQAEQALRESEEQLGLFAEHAPAALAMFDREMRYLHASRRWKADYNLGDRDLDGVSHYDIFPEIPEEWKEAHRRGLAGEVLSGDDDTFTSADGSVQWIRWEIRPWCKANGEIGGIVIFSEDTSKRKEAEAALLRNEKLAYQREQLQALAKRLQQVREEERKMVARDLHDQIGQILTAIKMDMAWAARHLPESEGQVHNRLKGSIEMINEGVRSVRKICSGLRPGILDDLGLAAAIEWQANEFASRTGVRCEISMPSTELRLDNDRATEIFRIFQECLTNVARHAEAQSVSASLKTEDENLVLIVQDDGKGFRESEVTGSLGVLGMKERAKVCGGDVQVSSSTGMGTTVTVRVPLHAASVEREE